MSTPNQDILIDIANIYIKKTYILIAIQIINLKLLLIVLPGTI